MEQEAEASMRKNRGARCRKPVIAGPFHREEQRGGFTRTVSSAAGGLERKRAEASRTHANEEQRVFEQKRKQSGGLAPERKPTWRGEPRYKL